jgi:hypothetical protein
MWLNQEGYLKRLLNGVDKELSIKWAIEYCEEEKFDKLEVIEVIDKGINTRLINIKFIEKRGNSEFNLKSIKNEEEMIKRYQEFITRLFDIKEEKIGEQVKEEKVINPNAYIIYGD